MKSELSTGDKVTFKLIKSLGIGQRAAARIRQELLNSGDIVQKGNVFTAV